MSDFNEIIKVRRSFENARNELYLAKDYLNKTGMFRDTKKEVDDNISDLSKSIDLLSKFLEEQLSLLSV